MLVYHRTRDSEAIMREGFRDGEDHYGTTHLYRGVWVSADGPVGVNEGADGDSVLVFDIPERLFEEYEWVEEAKGYREALIPAEDLNRYLANVRIFRDDEA